MGYLREVAIGLLGLVVIAASPVQVRANDAWADANAGRIGIITGGVTGTYVRIGADLSSVLDGYGGLRIITMLGKGSVQNIADLLYLQGVDVSVVQSDVLAWLKEREPDSLALDRISYVTKLFNEEVHILARKDINTISDLAGKKVNVGPIGSGTNLTASLLFPFFAVDIYRQNLDDRSALTELKAGRIDALMFVAGKPTPLILDNADISDQLHLVNIPMTAGLEEIYTATAFQPEDYPNLGMQAPVETVAVNAVMAVYDKFAENSPRYERLVRFSQGLVGQFDAFREPPRHPKWLEVDFSADVPGWKRFGPMEALIQGRNVNLQDSANVIQN